MRSKNQRLVIVGSVLIALAIAFFCSSCRSRRNQQSGRVDARRRPVSGVVGGIGIAMIVIGSIGKKKLDVE